jgi:hypothetical protein
VSYGLVRVLVVVVLVLGAVTAVLGAAGGDLLLIAQIPGVVVPALMGGLVVARRPAHPIGVLLCLLGTTGQVSEAVFAYARVAVVHFPGALPFGRPMMWATSWGYIPSVACVMLLILLFPDGRLVSPRWRLALWAVLAWLALALAGNAFVPQSLGSWFPGDSNPYAVQGPAFRVVFELSNGLAVALLLAALASMAVRWRRAGHVVRQQLMWLLATLPWSIAAWVIAQYLPQAVTLAVGLGVVSSLLTAAAIGLAVLRYRLDDIDVRVSRVVVYCALTIAVAGVYLAVVAIAGGLFGPGSGLTAQLLATVVAAGLLLPAYGRL